MGLEDYFMNFRTHNICIKRWKNIPLYSIRWSKSKVELLLFKFLPILVISTPCNYIEAEDGLWAAM